MISHVDASERCLKCTTKTRFPLSRFLYALVCLGVVLRNTHPSLYPYDYHKIHVLPIPRPPLLVAKQARLNIPILSNPTSPSVLSSIKYTSSPSPKLKSPPAQITNKVASTTKHDQAHKICVTGHATANKSLHPHQETNWKHHGLLEVNILPEFNILRGRRYNRRCCTC